LWTGSSDKSILGRIRVCSPDKDKQHNFRCLDFMRDEEPQAHSGREYALKFKTQSDSKEHIFAFASAAARDKCLQGFGNVSSSFDLEDYITIDAASSASFFLSVELVSFDITLRASQDLLHGDWAKVQIVGARFSADIGEETRANFNIQTLHGILSQGPSSFVFLNTSTSQASCADASFISVVYVQSATANSLEVNFSSSTDICLDKYLQNFFTHWWEFTKSDRRKIARSSRPLKSSPALLQASPSAAECDVDALSNVGENAASGPHLDIRVFVHAPRCIFASGNQVLVICWGNFEFKSEPSAILQLAGQSPQVSSFQLTADGYSLTFATLSDASERPDCTTDYGAKTKLLTTIIPECPFFLDMTVPDEESAKTGAIPSFTLHFAHPLHVSLDPAFVKFVIQDILPVANRLSFQSAIVADYLMKIFSGNDDVWFELTHEQQTEMLLRLRQEQHPKYELFRAQYELVRDSEQSDDFVQFCQQLGRIHQSMNQHEARYSVVVCFDQYVNLILKMSDDPSDPRAAAFCIKSSSKSIPFLIKILGAKIDAALAQSWGLECSISTVDAEGKTDLIWMDALLSSANFAIQDLETSTTLALSSEIIRASLSPQQVEFFTKLLRDFQDAMAVSHVAHEPSDGAQHAAHASVMVQVEPDDAATRTTRLSVTVHLSAIEVDLKLDAREAKQLRLVCQAVDFGMESTSRTSIDQPSQQVTNMKLSLKTISARSFCSHEEGLELVHAHADSDDRNSVSHCIFHVQMKQEQQQVEKSSANFISKNLILVESTHPIIFVIDARSICTLLLLATKLGDAAGNPKISITNSYEIEFSLKTLSLDLIISAEKHFRLSLCLPQDGSKSTNCVASSPGAHKSDQTMFIANVTFGVVLIGGDLHAATYQSYIIDNVSFSFKFEVGEHVAKNTVGIKAAGGINITISYQDLQQLYLFVFHPDRGMLPCWLETNGNPLQPAAASSDGSNQPFECVQIEMLTPRYWYYLTRIGMFLVEIPGTLSLEFANDCPPYAENLVCLEMEQFTAKATDTLSTVAFTNLVLGCGLDSVVSFEGGMQPYRTCARVLVALKLRWP